MNKLTASAMFFALTSCVWQPMPDRAKLIIDRENGTYASIPCVIHNTLERPLIKNPEEVDNVERALVLQDYADMTTAGEIRGKSLRPDSKCRAANGFGQDVGLWGLIFKQESRWTPEGEWRW
jgi:hypothetical protein